MFCNINDFCIEELGLRDSRRVHYETFVKFINERESILRKLKKRNISTFDLWAEIRGTIKGGLDNDWCRTAWFDQQAYSLNVMRELEKKELIFRNRSENKQFMLTKEVLYGNTLKKVSVSQETYDRGFIYNIAKEYQTWLGEERHDDNDLICMMLEKGSEEIEKFDFIVIDEVQDYTELQIYFISRLAKSTKGIIMAGDLHQIINPTMFREDRIKKLFSDELNICRLSQNFRCQDKIVEYANALANLRREYVATRVLVTMIRPESIIKSLIAERICINYLNCG